MRLHFSVIRLHIREKIHLKKIITLIILSIGLTACSPEVHQHVQTAMATSAQETPKLTADQIIVRIKAGIIASPFLDQVKIENDTLSIIYKEDPSMKEMYKKYWGVGDTIQKSLMSIPSQYLRLSDSFHRVQIVIPYEKRTYSIDIDRTTIENYFKVDLDTLTESASWREQIVDPYVNNDERRSAFVKAHIKVTP